MSKLKTLEKLRKLMQEHLDGWLKLDALAIANEIEVEIAERFAELPVDADGVPINAGDMIEFGEKGERLEVTHVGRTEHGDPTIAYRRPNGTLDCSCIGAECRHVKPRTIEDVLRECAEAYASGADVEMGGTGEMFAKYADEVRGLVVVR